jgi:hypothetical protein
MVEQERGVGRRTAIFGGAAIVATGTAVALVGNGQANAWVKPVIKSAIGAPASAASGGEGTPVEQFVVVIAGGESRSDGWRRITLFVGHAAGAAPVAGAQVSGNGLTVPGYDSIQWLTEPVTGSSPYAHTGSDGTATLYGRPAAPSAEFFNFGFAVALQDVESHLIGQGWLYREGDDLPAWVNDPPVTPIRELTVSLLGGERLDSLWRRVDAQVTYADTGVPAAGASIEGEIQTYPNWFTGSWWSSTSGSATTNLVTDDEGMVTGYFGTADPEQIYSSGCTATVLEAGEILAQGSGGWTNENLPAWVNAPPLAR